MLNFEHQYLIKSTGPSYEKTISLMIPFEAKFDNQFESEFHKYTKTRKAKVYLQFSFVAMKILHYYFITLDLRLLW